MDARRRRTLKAWGLAGVLLLTGCERPEPGYQPSFSFHPESSASEYVVGILPQHNMQKLVALYGPLIEEINAGMPEVRLRIELARDFETFEKKLFSGDFDFALLNPYQTVLSLKHGYRVFGKMADDAEFRGIILVRKDSLVRTLADLKGKKISYPSITAVAAGMLPQYFLQTHGVDVNRDVENLYVGSQESSIMNVFTGRVAAGVTWPPPWKTFMREHPELAAQLEVKWQTESLVNNGWVVRKNVPAPVADKFAAMLFALNRSAAGRQMLMQLPTSGFEPASNATYEPVRRFAQIFSRTVRTVEW